MKSSSGGKSHSVPSIDTKANILIRITRLMGDSFRLHSQALIGYVDDMDASDVSTPSMISQGADDNEDSVY
jgi:hypothetical protein